MSYDFNFSARGYEVTRPYDFWFYRFIGFNLLPDIPNNLISIDIDSTTSSNNGYLYITMKNQFLIVDLSTKTVKDLYSYTSKGRALETLDYETIEKSDVN